MFIRLGSALLALALLTGCGGRPQGVLKPIGEPPAGVDKVEMLVWTTRADAVDPGQMFTGERGDRARYADIAISIPPDGARKRGDVQWPSSDKPDATREFTTVTARTMPGEAEARTRLRALLAKKQGSALVFVHGYNTRFEEAVYRFAQIAHDTKAPAAPILFTWPSRGKVLSYVYDRESNNYSRDELERLLRTLAGDPAVREITILAHSMGNWVTLEALRQMAIREKRITPKIGNVLLAAPDVDANVFLRQIEAIGPERPPFTVFASRDDKALALSRKIGGDMDRLGAIDPKQEPLRSQLVAQRIAVVDLTDDAAPDPANHGKYTRSDQVAALLRGHLRSGATLSDSHAGVGESIGLIATSAASVAGRAASIAVSAPVAIIDGRTREGLGDQIEDLGGHVGATLSNTTGVVTRAR